MNFVVFAIVLLLGSCGLIRLEDKAKESGDPIPQFIIGCGVLLTSFIAFIISIMI